MRPDVTMPGYHKGRIPANKGKKYPAEILTPQEVSALFEQISSTTSIGLRNRAWWLAKRGSKSEFIRMGSGIPMRTN